MKISLIISIAFHILVFIIVGWKARFELKDNSAENVITAELMIPIKKNTNLEALSKKSTEVKKETQKPIKKNEPVKKEVKVTESPIKQKEVKKPPKPEKKTLEDNKKIDDLLKDLDEILEKSDVKEVSKDAKHVKNNKEFNSSKAMSISLKDSIKSQIYHCWNSNVSGVKNAKEIHVLIEMTLAEDGSVIESQVINENEFSGEKKEAFKIIAASALRAVKKCNPLKNLPKEDFDSWKFFTFDFDLSETIY